MEFGELRVAEDFALRIPPKDKEHAVTHVQAPRSCRRADVHAHAEIDLDVRSLWLMRNLRYVCVIECS